MFVMILARTLGINLDTPLDKIHFTITTQTSIPPSVNLYYYSSYDLGMAMSNEG